MLKLYFLLSILLILALVESKKLKSDSLVTYSDGTVRGLVYDTHRAFYGLPFARAPVDELRWENPVDPDIWDGIRDATYERPGCMQKCNLAPFACPANGTSEDCLFLNVYTPVSTDVKPKPVIVYVPGGAFTVGSGDVPLYDGKFFAEKGIVLVTINYRLGLLGFLGNDDLSLTGNYGFIDQVKALHWVRNNIEDFGGDPDSVTLMGESAGAMSVVAHLISPLSHNLFHRAVMHSSPTALGFKTQTEAKAKYEQFAKKAKCTDIECLRNLEGSEIIRIQGEMAKIVNFNDILSTFTPYTPVIDGDIIPDQPMTLIEQGNFNRVPVILGQNNEEARLFVYPVITLPILKKTYEDLIGFIFKAEKKEAILNAYPAPGGVVDHRPLLATVLNDFLFACPDRYLSRCLTQNSVEAHLYRFNHSNSFPAAKKYCDGVACHGDELPYVFNSYELIGLKFNDVEKELAKIMGKYWSNFVVNGDPNEGNMTPTYWEQYVNDDSANNAIKFFNDNPLSGNFDNDLPGCDLFDAWGYN